MRLRGSRQGHGSGEAEALVEMVAVLGCQGMRNDREEREVTFQRGKRCGSQGPAETMPSSGKGRQIKRGGVGEMKPFSSECSCFLTKPRNDVISWE